MKKTFRMHHLLELLDSFELGKVPLDGHISRYFRSHPSLGSKDRREIAETVYLLIRWLSLIDGWLEKKQNIPFDKIHWEERCQLLSEIHLDQARNDPILDLHEQVGFPKALFDLFVADWGLEKANELCLASNQEALTTIRVNPIKTTREALYTALKNRFPIEITETSPWGIRIKERINFHILDEFKKGLFEVQDEASQLCAEEIALQPGDLVLDYCAGAGGKTLAFAYKLQGKGQIYLHDVRKKALEEAKKRLKRAGIENGQILPFDAPYKSKLKAKMDWVIVDAPCTGTGTLRRNPDLKWRCTLEGLQELIALQRRLVEEALSFLKPGGRLLYVTCSLLKAESEEQSLYFENTHLLHKEKEPFRSFPAKGGMDGFFAVVLQKKAF